MVEVVLETQNLTKRYGDFVAVNNLNLVLGSGQVFGLLGPNGAGKTTSILMLLGLTEPTSGFVRVLGLDPTRNPLAVKARVGYLPDQIGFYDELTARENLGYIARLNGISRPEAKRRIEAALERMGLAEVAEKRVRTFSRGMRQRLGLAELLLKQPRIIIMDEPTLGLDPEAARDFLNLIRELKNDNITVLLSSHMLHQVQAVCDRVGLFHKGVMVLEGSVPELARNVLGGAYRIHVQAESRNGDVEHALQGLPGVLAVQRPAASQYVVEAAHDLRAEAAQAVIQAGGRLAALDMAEPSLDDIYTRYFQEVQHGARN
ncbi:MAG: ABC transporter ATP-binding protein [Chloroflexaceae bacterium]|jgi:ABC-2 type transport system ATP-binding protein|nr:ABC transporter ATP-binding protein [Chloroflexaceae bacterium]